MTTSFLLVDRETAVIDAHRPQVDYTAPYVSQGDTPGEDPQRFVPVDKPTLPPTDVGGQPGSGYLNGFSTGFRGLVARTQRFSGAVAKPPQITNPVQGEVGMNNRTAKRDAGVMSQLVQYVVAPQAYAAAWVGNISPARVVTGSKGNDA